MKVYVVLRADDHYEGRTIDSIYLSEYTAKAKVKELKKKYPIVYIEEHKFYE